VQPAISSIAPFTHRGLRRTGTVMPMRRALPAVFGLLALGAVPSVHAQPRETPVTCTNPVSGTNWQIRIDYDKGTVDSNPARISAGEIAWRDLKDGWNYTLDRKTGNLTVIIASATGGNFLYHRCKLEN
jgi:hypothetical protein